MQEILAYLLTGGSYGSILFVTKYRYLVKLADLARVMGTDKTKSELIIMPVLAEIHELIRDRNSLFSGKAFNFDASLDLNGVCNYVIAESPVVVMVEAKQGDLNNGWGQCISEMVASQKFNEIAQEVIPAVYGVVTNGMLWHKPSERDYTLTKKVSKY
jgi:hypothetical protein